MDHLLEEWDEVKELFLNPIFLISDYDGTLAPIVERPGDAELSESMKKPLSELINFCPVGVISGRALDDLIPRVGIEKIYYSGNHGYEIRGPDVDFVKAEAEEAEEPIRRICNSIEKRSGSIEGVLVENKGFTASVHYRLVDEKEVSELRRIVEEEVEPYKKEGAIEINYGREVFEIRPRGEWDKGEAVSLLRRVAGLEEEALPVYLGDDVTDEDVFFTLGDRGVGIVISEEERETAADFRLRGTDEVEEFLNRLLEILSEV